METLNGQQGSKLLKLQKIGDIYLEVVPYTTLNTTTGVLVFRDLLRANCTEEKITFELALQGVITCQS